MPVNDLIPGEKLNLDPIIEPDPGGSSDETIVRRYSSGEVRIVTDQARTQLAELPLVLESGRYELKPEYQRRHRWSVGKKSRLIESFIMNVPVPPIFVYEYEYSKYEVMDGLQRLTAIWDFYRNRFELAELEYWPELNGRIYDNLPLQLRQAIDRRYISSIVLLYETAQDQGDAQQLKELVFERINSGGVTLEPQESRNALSKGPLNAVLPRLARTPSFCRAWGIPEPENDADDLDSPSEDVLRDPRFQSMEDVEMVLRFFAHRQRGVEGPRRLKPFLDQYWSRANETYSRDLVEEIGALFVRTIDLVVEVLGERAFYIRRERGGRRDWVPRPTLLAYDSVMSAFSQQLDQEHDLVARKAEVSEKLGALYDEYSTEFDGRKTDPKDVLRRDALILEMLNRVLDAK
ncbi:GmrSD restriction endonuclease domain-containing protein [Jiangella endophytica]|uniref:GmrSD restriction endonuclease domain-containing protein n=1 Tax=Jiangella endophytica TaxID=1623398 RepID=UPI001300B4E2|nr:DUF262 domain-containing protein [Jiangella endophytica]